MWGDVYFKTRRSGTPAKDVSVAHPWLFAALLRANM
jgi:hypothetical protein